MPEGLYHIQHKDGRGQVEKVRYYECPLCKYRIADVEMESMRLDYGCPNTVPGWPGTPDKVRRCDVAFKNFMLKEEEQ